MWNSIALMAGGLSWGERASTAGIVTLQGMLTVFLVLAILWGGIELMHRLLHKGDKENRVEKVPSPEKKAKKEPKKKAEKVAAPNANDAAVAAAIAAALAASEDNGAVVAAITAAISAKMAEEGYTGGFRVVSFKRVTAQGRRKF